MNKTCAVLQQLKTVIIQIACDIHFEFKKDKLKCLFSRLRKVNYINSLKIIKKGVVGTHTHIHTPIHTHIHTHTHIHIYIHTYIHTHVKFNMKVKT
jgi:hypothetical protein